MAELPPGDAQGGDRSPELQHFRAFEAILRLGSLTAAAQELGLSQPALSKSLALLRRYYGDELFTRNKLGMRPTAQAKRLREHVSQLLGLFDRELRARPGFDPATSQRVFRVSCTEAGAVHFMPRLAAEVRDQAPGVRWEVVPLAGDGVASALANGDIDLVLAAYVETGGGICSEFLYRAGHRCLVRSDHPRIGTQLSLDAFCKERHVVAAFGDTRHAYNRVEQAIIRAAGDDAVGMRVHSLLIAPFVVARSDHVFTATELIANQLAQLPGLKVLDCPLDLPLLQVHQYWHSRYADDPALLWLRRLVASHFKAADS